MSIWSGKFHLQMGSWTLLLSVTPSTSHQFFCYLASISYFLELEGSLQNNQIWRPYVLMMVTHDKKYFTLQPIVHVFHRNIGNTRKSWFYWLVLNATCNTTKLIMQLTVWKLSFLLFLPTPNPTTECCPFFKRSLNLEKCEIECRMFCCNKEGGGDKLWLKLEGFSLKPP